MALDDHRHPDAERLAEYADGVLGADVRAEVETHLVDCADCRAVLTETIAFVTSDRAGGRTHGTAFAPRVLPFQSRRWVRGAAAGLAAAAALVLVVRLARPDLLAPMFVARSNRPELQELIAAVANEPTRPVEGRLTGGFKYGPPPSATRGAGDRDVSPDVRIAAAKIEKLARADDTPQHRAELGLAYLALGDLDKAVEAMEDAAQQDAGNAQFQSDLAAAYLARARSRDRAEDWARALAAADRAIKADPRRAEAYFNRALALEGLHLTDQALDAWTAYQALEPATPWSRESATRMQTLRDRRQRSAVPGPTSDHQALRERIEDRVLGDWGRAVVGGQRQAAEASLAQAETLAGELAAGGGDAMPRDETRLIRRVEAAGNSAGLRELALGHDGYERARTSYVANRQEEAAELMSQAAGHLSRGGSAYASWAPIFKAIFLRNNGEPQHAIDVLAAIPLDRLPAEYHNLRGRLEWTDGVALDELGRFDLGSERLKRAVDEFERAGEGQNVIATRTILAEAKGLLGDRAGAWTDLIAVFEDADRAAPSRRSYHFRVGATLALGAGLPETALELHNAGLLVIEGARDKAEAHLRRARTLALLGDRTGALSDLQQAAGAVAAMDDRALRDRNDADVRIVRAEVLRATDGRAALEDSNAALAYVARADPAIRLAGLFMLRAKCREALNDVRGAEEDLGSAIETFERKRSTLATAQDRMQAFEQERAAFKDLVRLEIATRNDNGAALRIAERARAGVLLENWSGPSRVPVDPAVAYRELPPDIAVVYYETLPDRVLGWVLTRERCVHFTRPMSLAALGTMVARIERLIRDGADLDSLKPHSAPLYDALVAPALALAGDKPTIFFVPDGPLFLVPFGALPDALGRPLIAMRTVGVVPSLTTFLAASARLSRFRADDVLAVGDGHDPAASSLPRLPHADEEATAVGALYPTRVVLTGSAATRRGMLEGRHAVIHFAGHTIVNLQFPLFSRMLLAPDSGDRDSGSMMASEITHDRFEAARVVVLATCEGAAGRLLEGEGVISIARAFFGAGVPSVVASLWPVDDDSHGMLTAFHRELRRSPDAARALRAVQLARLRNDGPHTPIRAWGGFVALGGATPAN